MPVRQVKVIFFDAVGTLIETRGCVGEIYVRAAREFGFDRASNPATKLRTFVSAPAAAGFPSGRLKPH